MKYVNLFMLIGTVLLFSCESTTQSEEPQEESVVQNGIQWTGENETANYLTIRGINHWINIEFDKAYVLWEEAVTLDPTLFAPQTMLSMMSDGEKSEMHKNLAKEHVFDNNETSKVFVSLLDAENGDDRRAAWAKMRELSNGPFIHHMYARSLGNSDDQSALLAELDKVISFCNENGYTETEAASYNIKAYVLQQSGDLEGATEAANKYTELWDGSNALDSRAEMYLFAGDTVNAIAWYKKTLEKYPFAVAAKEHLGELEPDEPDATDE